MKKLVVLLVVFLGLGAFVYFYEIRGKEERDQVQELEESLLRLTGEDSVEAIGIEREGKQPLRLVKEGDSWMLKEPVESAADETTVNTLLSNLTSAKRDRVLEQVAQLSDYGLQDSPNRLHISDSGEERTLLIGSKDFSGGKLFVKFLDAPEIILTSSSLQTAVDKELKEWRNRKVLQFSRNQVEAVELVQDGGRILLEKQGDEWHLKAPLQERADDSTVSSLLSSVEFAEAQEFVSEDSEELEAFGLAAAPLSLRLREAGQETWRSLELGAATGEHYFARQPDRSSVFTVLGSVHENLRKSLFEFRDKDVVNVKQDQITRLRIEGGQESTIVRREDYKWIIESPESQQGQEAAAYKLWYPIDDIEFESIDDVGLGSFENPQITLVIELADGSTRSFSFLQDGEVFRARRQDGRQGQISKESFEKLQVKAEDLI